MTQTLFRDDDHLTECSATVTALTEKGMVLDRTVFYPLGGGQAGDAGVLVLADGREINVADTRKEKNEKGQFTQAICHLPALTGPAVSVLEQLLLDGVKVGDVLTARIDWARLTKIEKKSATTPRGAGFRHLLLRSDEV